MSTTLPTQFDYIIVGAGSAGAALAHRLSEDAEVSVCLLEAGGKDRNPLIHIPFGLSLISRIEGIGWGYNTAPQVNLNGRELFWPRGRTLGGSSSINAMCYIRGASNDYDNWAAQGASGWDWQSVLPYFKKAQDQQRGPDEFHGVGGPLTVSDLRQVDELSQTFVDAADNVGLEKVSDFNSDKREGLGLYQVTQRNGQRCSTAKGYLSDARQRPNLTIMTGCMVERIIIKQGKAQGVQVRRNGKVQRLAAAQEVILSGGAINSPQLLMLSGIGPREHLQDKGIHVQVDLPGVGQNLQDHLDAIVQYYCKAHEGYAVAASALPKYIGAAFEYLFKRKGILSSNIAEAGGFMKSSLASDDPDIQFHFLPAILKDHGRQIQTGYGFGIHVCNLYPKSRGEIRLQSNHPDDHPLIDPRYLEHPDDAQVMIEGIRKAREILQSQGFTKYVGREVSPGIDQMSDEQLLEFIRSNSETIYHPIGTCKMGQADDPTSVVDEQLRVKGVDGLRVVDASVMPSLIGGNTNAPTIMIAEKAADMIKQSRKLQALTTPQQSIIDSTDDTPLREVVTS
ncbi:GMC family oxidoreductase [Aestuariibacter salexigens]|uniref:GMC family oxidoreductase n=1 Tax=Aestuariibacter salexigens TaxID=226010 RepID=UPI00041197E5|nr:choline dehydrogenase [Aestuariibacter salexigens]